MTTWTIVFNFAMFIVALASAIAAWCSISTAKKADRGTVLKQLIEEYSESDMCQALRLLIHWQEKHCKDSSKIWKQKLKQNDKTAQDVEGARRKVSHYFQKIFNLHKMGVIEDKVFTHFSGYDGVNIFLGIVESLEYELNELYDKSAFKAFRKYKKMPSKVDKEIPPEEKD